MKIAVRLLCLCAFVFSGIANAANVLIVHDGTAGLEADVLGNLTAKFVAHGDTVTANVGVPGSLAGYQQVWDIRFNNTTPLTPSDISLYVAYMAAGNSLFVIGENVAFATRNNSIVTLVSSAGGGALTLVPPQNTETVRAPFTGPNALSTITFLAAEGIDVVGAAAAPIAYDASNIAAAVVWGPGAMSAASSGSLIVVFDVNFLQAGADANSQALTANLISYLAAPTVVPTIPLPIPSNIPTLSEWGMIALSCLIGILGLVQMRRRDDMTV